MKKPQNNQKLTHSQEIKTKNQYLLKQKPQFTESPSPHQPRTMEKSFWWGLLDRVSPLRRGRNNDATDNDFYEDIPAQDQEDGNLTSSEQNQTLGVDSNQTELIDGQFQDGQGQVEADHFEEDEQQVYQEVSQF